MPIGHLPTMPRARAWCNCVGATKASGHSSLKSECLLLTTVWSMGVILEHQVRLWDVALGSGEKALLSLEGAGRLSQAGIVCLQSPRKQWGAPLTVVRWWGGVTTVLHHSSVGDERSWLWWHWRELTAASPWCAGVRQRRDGALAQGACALQEREKPDTEFWVVQQKPGPASTKAGKGRKGREYFCLCWPSFPELKKLALCIII